MLGYAVATTAPDDTTVPNRLISEKSPYLLQHAHNPVDWYPWGDEALEKAKREDKPILVSVGYSTCYWCHVMEREVFERADIAAQMNEHFVCIKVDREERPDLDEICMAATQLLTRSGGWPNNVFFTPDLKPFFAGTYFGPVDVAERPGFPHVLEVLHDYWNSRRTEVLESAESLDNAVHMLLEGERDESVGTLEVGQASRLMREYVQTAFDMVHGGFNVAPKFPQESMLLYVLDQVRQGHDAGGERMLGLTLSSMAAGGMHDHVGGGFHRYSVDAGWKVPHFEKMLYNQAQMSLLYAGFYSWKPHPYYRDVVMSTLGFVERELMDEKGGFYSGIDAETDAVEGAYYVWRGDELEKALSEPDIALLEGFCHFADVPLFSGHKHPDGRVLYLKKPMDNLSNTGADYATVAHRLGQSMDKLLQYRAARKRPHTDQKMILSWNGLMITAFAEAGLLLVEKACVDTAERAAKRLMKDACENGRLRRVLYPDGTCSGEGCLEDYAFMIMGLIRLLKATAKQEWMEQALQLLTEAENRFYDAAKGGFYLTLKDKHLGIALKGADDGALPSANAVMVHNYVDLYLITGEEDYLHRADACLHAFGAKVMQYVPRHPTLLHAAIRLERCRPAHMSNVVQFRKPAPKDEKRPLPRKPTLSSEYVTMEAVAGKVGKDKQVKVTITMDIAEGWHIYGAGEREEWLQPTRLDVQSETPLELLDTDWPKGETMELSHSASVQSRDISVFSGKIKIALKLKLHDAPEDEALLHVRVSYQACSDSVCLAPALSSVMLAIPVKAKQ